MRVSRSSAACARLVFALLVVGALFCLPAAQPPTSYALGTVAATQNLSNTSDAYTEHPSIDSANDRLTAVWTEREAGDSESKDNGKLAYTTTTVGSELPRADVRSTNSWSKFQWADVVVDPTNGDSHIVFSVGSDVIYRRRTVAGNQSTKTIASDSLPNAAKIARGKSGLLWAVWRNGDGSKISYRFSTDNGDNWQDGAGNGTVASESSGTHVWPTVVIDDNDGVHVFWSKSKGSARGEIVYGDWNGSGFTTGNITNDTANPYDAEPSAVLDSNNVIHVIWRKQAKTSPNEIWEIRHAQRPASGGTWAGYDILVSVAGDVFRAPSVDVDDANNVYVSFSEPVTGGKRRAAMVSFINGKVERGPDLPYRTFVSITDIAVSSQGNVQAHVAYQDDVGGNGDVYYARVDIGPVGPAATPNIIPTTTNQRSVNVAFEAQSGGPEQVRWRWNAAPTDAENDSNGWQTLPASQRSIDLPASLSTSACGVQTLYTQVRNANATQAIPKTDSVIYDAAAQATVRVTNPYLNGLPKTFTPKVADTYTKPTDGAYNGDERYTRIPQYFVGIYNNGDCSGLASFSIPVSNVNGSITNGTYENKLSLAQGSIPAPGAQTNVTVVVGDSVPNLTNYSSALIYDPADTNPSATVTNTLGLPVLNDGSFTVDSANSIIRELTFSSVDVDDTTYGDFENLAAGKQFWGVWIANSRSQVDPNTANLQWFPVHVPTPGASFKVSWNIFNGIPGANRTTGTYFIYVKFLDGAGNATVETLPVEQAGLTEGFSVPTIYVPRITK